MIFCYILAALFALLVAHILFVVLCALFVDPNKVYDRHSRLYRHLLNADTAIALRLMRVRVHTRGTEKIPQDTKRLLFVGNHRSNLDPIVTWYALKKWDIAFLSKAENFKIPIYGRIICKCCFLTIDRQDPRKAMTAIASAARLLESEQVSVGVYPEGTRSKDCRLLPFHNGVFKIAQKAQAPIVVLAVTGTERMHRNFPLHRTDVTLEVLGVIPAEAVAQSKTAQLGDAVRAMLAQHLEPTQIS